MGFYYNFIIWYNSVKHLLIMNEPLEKLIIASTTDTPSVTLDKENGIFEIKGISLPANIFGFYNPIINWLIKYSENPNEETKFEFKFSYLNSSSAKIVSEIMTILKRIEEKNKKVDIVWRYKHEDFEIKEMGVEFSDTLNLPVNVIDDGI